MKRSRSVIALAVVAGALAGQGACSSDTDPPPAAAGTGGQGGGEGGQGGITSSTSATSVVSSSGTTGGGLPDTFTVTGVVTDGEQPVEGAIVMQGGGMPALTTGPDGSYTIELTQAIPGTPTVVATKIGYRTIGVEFLELPTRPVEIALKYVTPPDNPAYVYRDPGTGDPVLDNSTAYCGHCHTTFTAQFQTSAHAKATRDPLVQDLYAGVSGAHATQAACEGAGGVWRAGLVPGTAASSAAKCYLGGGVLPDLNLQCGGPGELACDDPALPAADKPAAFGGCADCHAPGIDGPAGGRSLHEAVGLSFDNGVHCDVCHHVRDIDLSQPPGVAGRLQLQRPRDKVSEEPGADIVQVMFGPLLDVPNEFMGGSYQPKFSTSEFCAGCHDQRQEALLPGAALDPARWPDGLPTHSTFTEWSEGPFNTPGSQCQFCHMPQDDTGLESTLDVTNAGNASITSGFLRPPGQIRKHIFRGPLEGSPRLIDGALALFLTASSDGANLTAQITIQNVLAGHAIPTGEPMRSLVLVVRADACNAPMQGSGGMTLNDVAGAGAEGVVGADVSIAGATVTWAAGAARAQPGDVIRIARPTGVYDDYVGIGLFADPGLTAMEKGLEIRTPVAEAAVVAVGGGSLTLASAVVVQPGDLVYLGDPLLAAPADGDASRALAGAAGYTFARVLVDPAGSRGVPHYRAVDIVSDNRIAPEAQVTTTHSFAVPMGCADATVTATLLYRPIPVGLGRERGWSPVDYVVASATEDVALP
jgi:Cytochrome c554 and c-prime